MNRVRFISVVTLVVLCMSAGIVAAEDEELTWPRKPGLIAKDWTSDDYMAEVQVGDVSIWNTPTQLFIKMVPFDGFKFKEVNIHPADRPEDFDALLDKKGKPKIPAL